MSELRNDGMLATVIMAAGQGKRMNNPSIAKVLYEIGGKPMIGHVVELAHRCNASPVIVVVGHQREAVIDYLRIYDGNIETVVQDPQLGTGHAVMQAESPLKDYTGDVIVLSGDVPMLRKDTIDSILRLHRETEASATVLTAELKDPTGYGRIIRKPDGSVEKIVEHKDATDAELQINEINSGIYIFRCRDLFDALQKIKPENAQKEYYLTDVFGIFRHEGKTISALKADDPDEINGINTMEQLDAMNRLYANEVQSQQNR
jgi:UDP-N-acetylglucosamine pyrophosphorylase